MILRAVMTALVALSLSDSVAPRIFEGRPSSIYTDCLQRAGQSLRRYPNQKASDEALEWACVQSYLWQTAAEREAPRNLTRRQVNFLTTLVGQPRSTRAWEVLKGGSSINTRPPVTFATPTRRPPFTFAPQTTRLPPFTFAPRTTRRPPFTFAPRTTRRPPFTFAPRTTRRFTFFPNIFNRFQVNANVNRRTKRNEHERLKRSVASIPRKEYRALTDAERNAFHTALDLAKTDTSLPPNVYDFLASLHSGVLANGAHGGPAFLGFHRIYILLMDLVICYFDVTNTVRLPFWDNTMDNEMTNPTASIMWHSSFAGQGNGFVNNGPFGSWATINGPSIRRAVGSGSLMSKADMDAVLTRTLLTEISRPTAAPAFDLEGHHGRVHGWVGGDMGALNTATNDPVFFMHHAFIDCIWERFRSRQQSIGINPSTDYPNTFQTYHRPTDSIGIIPTITNSQAVSSFYASLATCEWPQCPLCGNSPYLECVGNRCVPVISDEADPCPACPGNSPGGYNGYQNSYCVNGYCDTGEWAYLPVQITYNRPPDYDVGESYRSYPVRSGRAQTQYDIYSPRSYTGPFSRTYRQQDRSSRYTDCGCRDGVASSGSVYIQSYGMNYDGYYRESTVVDRRYALSSNTGYVAVRKPRFRAAQSYVSVYDDCGRLCRPTCWDSRSQRYVDCSGAVTVTSEGGRNRGYGETYEEATYQVWDYGTSQSYRHPRYRPENVYLNYVCDYSGTFPWEDYRG